MITAMSDEVPAIILEFFQPYDVVPNVSHPFIIYCYTRVKYAHQRNYTYLVRIF